MPYNLHITTTLHSINYRTFCKCLYISTLIFILFLIFLSFVLISILCFNNAGFMHRYFGIWTGKYLLYLVGRCQVLVQSVGISSRIDLPVLFLYPILYFLMRQGSLKSTLLPDQGMAWLNQKGLYRRSTIKSCSDPRLSTGHLSVGNNWIKTWWVQGSSRI